MAAATTIRGGERQEIITVKHMKCENTSPESQVGKTSQSHLVSHGG